MPLSKARNRERMRQTRVQPKSDVKAKLAKAGLKLDGKRILGALQSTRSLLESESNTVAPLYNPRLHKSGDIVRKWVGGRYIEVEIKEVDGEGNEVPGYY